MPKVKKATQRNNKQESIEATLWQSADKLRKNMDAAEYKHVVLGLIFLKYISDAFEVLHSKLVEGKGDYEGADPEDPNEYTAEKVFFVPPIARWKPISANAKKTEILLDNGKKVDIGGYVDEAMEAIERQNLSLKGVLPKVYARQNLDRASLGGLIDLVGTIALGTEEAKSKDVLGQVYEYFLGQFALAEGKKGGQFYTPRSVVRLLVEMLEPYEGRVFDPCCGSGGMFVQSEKFIKAHQDHYKKKSNGLSLNPLDRISIYGQESNQTTWRLAKMNLAIRGIDSSNIKWNNEGSFLNNAHKDLKADFIIANPPFNDSDWSGDLLKDDARWTYGIPPTSNANYAWIQHFAYHLSPKGTAGFVLSNSALSTTRSGQDDIRKAIINNDLIDCIVVLPNQLFYNTQIPASLWFLSRAKLEHGKNHILVIDARAMGYSVASDRIELKHEEINQIATLYLDWKKGNISSLNIPGLSKVATLEEIELNIFNLSPNKYIDIPVGNEQTLLDVTCFHKDSFSYVQQKENASKLLIKNLQKYNYKHLSELDYLAMKTGDLISIGSSLFHGWFKKFQIPAKLTDSISKKRQHIKDFGEIPTNWHVCELQTVCDVVDCLHSSKPDFYKSNKVLLEVYNIANDGLITLSSKYTIAENEYKAWTKNIEVQEGDCVITNVGRIAAIGQIPFNRKFAIGRNITAIRPIPKKMTPTYLLGYLLSDYMKTQTYRQTDIGTIMDSLNVKGIRPLKIIVPPIPLIEAFEEIARPLRHLVELSISIE
jgi:type I restriction enzyme M protein